MVPQDETSIESSNTFWDQNRFVGFFHLFNDRGIHVRPRFGIRREISRNGRSIHSINNRAGSGLGDSPFLGTDWIQTNSEMGYSTPEMNRKRNLYWFYPLF
jgi:hypothetical protein